MSYRIHTWFEDLCSSSHWRVVELQSLAKKVAAMRLKGLETIQEFKDNMNMIMFFKDQGHNKFWQQIEGNSWRSRTSGNLARNPLKFWPDNRHKR